MVSVVEVDVVVLGVVIGTLLIALLSGVALAVTNIGTFSTTGFASAPFLLLFVTFKDLGDIALGPLGILTLGPFGCCLTFDEGIHGGRAGFFLRGPLGSEGIAS